MYNEVNWRLQCQIVIHVTVFLCGQATLYSLWWPHQQCNFNSSLLSLLVASQFARRFSVCFRFSVLDLDGFLLVSLLWLVSRARARASGQVTLYSQLLMVLQTVYLQSSLVGTTLGICKYRGRSYIHMSFCCMISFSTVGMSICIATPKSSICFATSICSEDG